ncbi:MAG TPA: choice-of-anchor P family protein [Pseudonocardiaceae bacterium]|nr:choice-of-anchor P family protein [Pseudonocardiaceae bacterium]
MRLRIARRGGVLGLAAVAALLAGIAPAAAAPGAGSAYGVQVNVTLLGASAVHVGPLAPASTSGPATDSVASATVPGILTAGVLDTSAAKDPDTGAVTASASTADVGLPVLSGLGTVKAKLIAAKCVATQAGESGTATLTDAQLGGLGALAVNPKPNTVIAIKLPGIGNVASLTLNEQIQHQDGSLTVNAFHLHLLGGYGIGHLGSGDVIISSATCGPAGLPVPMASGAGLWIGLGLLGVIAVPVGATVLRRRRASLPTSV